MKILIPASIVLSVLSATPVIAGPCTIEIEALAKTLAAKDAGSGPTPGANAQAQPSANQPPQHPPSAIMSQETQGKATSPEDVRRQTAGEPTAVQQGTTGAAGDAMAASSALSRARALDQQGKEAECMVAVREAKHLATAR